MQTTTGHVHASLWPKPRSCFAGRHLAHHRLLPHPLFAPSYSVCATLRAIGWATRARRRERTDLAKGTLAAHRLHGPFPAACAIHHRSSLPCGAVLPLLMSSPMLSRRHRLVPCRGQTWSQIWRDCVGSASSTTTAMKPSPSMPPPATRRMRPPRRHPPSSHGLSPLIAAPHRIWPCDPAASRHLAPKRRPSLPKAASPPTSNEIRRLDLRGGSCEPRRRSPDEPPALPAPRSSSGEERGEIK